MGIITLHFLGGGGCLICLIVLVVKLLTGFKAFGPPVKDFALGVSAVILDGPFVVQILEGVKVSSIPKTILKRYVISTFFYSQGAIKHPFSLVVQLIVWIC